VIFSTIYLQGYLGRLRVEASKIREQQ